MRSKSYLARTVITILAIGVFALVLWRWQDTRLAMRSANEPTVEPPTERGRFAGQAQDPRERYDSLVRKLNSSPGPEKSREVFEEMRRLLSGMPAPAAAALIRNLLDSQVDVPSRLDFTLGRDGFLDQPSSLRVFLLDFLARTDRQAAAAYAEKTFSSRNSPDEWAIALRNYALGNPGPEARSFLQARLREMIQNESWQKNPSVGFLEAFDVAVHAGGTELLPDLTALLRQKDNPAVAHAAYLALDRMVLQDPAALLEKLQNEPDLMNGREITRANYFARANVEDSQQKSTLEAYLLDSHRSAAELETFAGLYPNGNFSVSRNLLTRVATPTRESLARQDREAFRVIEGWTVDPRFAKVTSYLQKITSRLQTFVSAEP